MPRKSGLFFFLLENIFQSDKKFERIGKMIEAPTTDRTRNAFDAAHAARGAMLNDFWAWFRGKRTFR